MFYSTEHRGNAYIVAAKWQRYDKFSELDYDVLSNIMVRTQLTSNILLVSCWRSKPSVRPKIPTCDSRGQAAKMQLAIYLGQGEALAHLGPYRYY